MDRLPKKRAMLLRWSITADWMAYSTPAHSGGQPGSGSSTVPPVDWKYGREMLGSTSDGNGGAVEMPSST